MHFSADGQRAFFNQAVGQYGAGERSNGAWTISTIGTVDRVALRRESHALWCCLLFCCF